MTFFVAVVVVVALCLKVAKYGIKILNLSRNIVSVQVLGRCFAFFTLHDQLWRKKTFVAGWRKSRAQRKVECGSTLSDKFWLCSSFSSKAQLVTQNLLMIREKLYPCRRNTFSYEWFYTKTNFDRPTLRVLKQLRRMCCLCKYICKWLDVQLFSDKDYKPMVPSPASSVMHD